MMRLNDDLVRLMVEEYPNVSIWRKTFKKSGAQIFYTGRANEREGIFFRKTLIGE